MASFRTHFSFGIASGILSAIAVTSLALAPHSFTFSVLIGLAVTLGAQLPDMDSDSGLPFHITFSSLSLVSAILTALYIWQSNPENYSLLVIAPIVVFCFVWGVVGYVFKRFTKHRGLAHSVPASLLAGLITFSFVSWLGFADWQAFLLGIALSLGYLIHLILDEIWAGLNFHGQLFVPNKAFGSALKFTSHNRVLTALMYTAIIGMIFVNFANFKDLTMQLLSAF
jgi:hypothetical protein